MAALLISAGNAFAQAPLNDDFAGRAILIGENATVNGSNFNATAEAGEPFFGAGTNSVWWSWTAPATGEFRINTVGSSFDTTLAVFTGSSVGELTRIASDDDSAGAGKSQVSFMARAGKQYQIQVSGGVYSAQGGIKLTISNNDSFVNRGILWGNIASAIGSNANATAEAGEPFPAAGRDSVWWSWTAPSSGTAILRTFNSKFDTVLAVYTGTSVSSLTMVGSNDDATTTLQSHLEIPVTEGVQYQIQVSSHDGQTGPISLSIAYVNTAAPDSISLSKGWMDETDSTGVTVATLGSTDPDAGDVAVFSLVPGEGAEDNESFTVSGNQLRTKSSVLYDAKRTVFIRLRATDRGGLSFERAFSMLVVPAVPNAEFVRKSLPFIQAPNYVNAIFQLIGKENGKAINYPKDFFDPGSGSYRPQLFRAFEAASITQSATPVSLQESYMQVAKLEEVPAKVRTVLLLDISRSLALDDLAAIKEAAKQMVDLMFDEQEIAIFSFAGSINPVAPFTGNKSKDTLKAAIDKISRSASNTTNLYGGIAEMLRLQAWKESFSLNGIETGFLVALTDGEDTSGSASLEDVIRLRDDLDPSDGVVGIRSIYTVGLGASINEEVLADIGNAGYYGVTEASSLAGKFVEIQRDIIDQANSYYWVNYSSPKRRSTPPGQLRKLELRLLNNTNTEPDGVLSSTFLSDTFTDLDSALYVNRRADMPAGVSVLEIPRDTISTASAFTIYPPLDFSAYTWTIGNPLLAEIVETSDEGDRVVIQPKGRNGTTTLTVTDVISDAVGDFTKEITLVIGSGVNPSTQTINFAALPDKSPSSLPFPLSGSSSSGLPVSFRIVSGPATITGNTVMLTGGTGPVTVRASQAGDESHYAAPDVTRTFNVAQDPLAGFLSAAGIPLEKQGSMDDPDGDGVGNLLEYAFNLNPASPAGARPMAAGGLSGLPRITANPNGLPPGFQIEYLRRKGGALLYTSEVSNDLKTFTPMPGTPAVSSINTEWERVNLTESTPPSAARRFARVRVSGTVVPGAPAVTIPPVATQMHTGKTATLRVEGSGSGLSYQWYRGNFGDTSSPVGTNSPIFTTPPLTATTSYWVRITNASGSTDSQAVLVSVTQPIMGPVIAVQPASTVVPSDSAATLSVSVSGTSPFLYQWYQGEEGDSSKPVGTNSSSLTTSPLTAPTSFWVSISNPAGFVDSKAAAIAIKPNITTHPGSITISNGQNTTLSVAATGPGPLSYQWYVGNSGNTTTPVGTNSSSFTTPTLSANTSYWVRVSNAAGTADSSTGTVSIRPVIVTHPVSTTVGSGQTASLSVTATGPSPLSYQWYQGAIGMTTTPVGANSASFTTPALSANTTYWVRVSNASGSADSLAATISVRPSITTQPASVSIASGQTATLSVAAIGPAPLTYQWYQGTAGTTTTPVGTNSASFTTPALTNPASYWVRVSNPAGSIDSSTATISVGPSIFLQPVSTTISSGQTATLTVTATGSTPLTYQWYQGAVGVTTTPVGTNSVSFTTPVLTTTTAYWVRVSNAVGSVNSTASVISIRPIITTQPASVTIPSGQTATLSVFASGPGPLSYQWYQGALGSTSTPVGTNEANFTTPALTSSRYYWVRVSNSAGSVDSSLASISILVAPTITTQPASVTIPSGQTATLSVSAIGSAPLTYQWYQGAVGTTTTLVGTNSNSFTIPPLSATTTYWVRVSNPAGSVNSSQAIVTMVPADLALIRAGAFTMGVTSGDTDENAPPVVVTVSDFYMGKNEVTKALWDEVRTWATENGYTDLATGAGNAANHPVQTVSWWDVIKWCNARSEKEGHTPCYMVTGAVMRTGITAPTVNWSANGYRLPTEAEWEKAARGNGNGVRFPWGTDTISHNQANFNNEGSLTYAYGTTGWHPTYNDGGMPYTSPVGSFAAYGYGMNDMVGNVSEWCWDWYGALTYVNGATDPRGAASGSSRVVRGGSWASSASSCRAANRSYTDPWRTFSDLGFRIARSSVEPISPSITVQPGSTLISSGQTATIAVMASGTGPLTYQWYQGEKGVITTPVGTNSVSFRTPVLTTTTTYWVRVSNAIGSVDSLAATISVRPSITSQPTSVSIASGQTATLSVSASGPAPLTYQWYEGTAGTTITPVGTNSASFTTPALTATTTYWVRVSNTAGSVDSATATISVVPSITLQPASVSIASGQTATLSVSAIGPAPLTYQWYQGTAGTTTTPVGTNSASFTTPALTNPASYWVRVSNAAGGVDSSTATISVGPSITLQPVSTTISSGQTATLTVTATGSAPLTYQWYRGAVGVTTTPVGTNSATFTTPALTATTTYWVRITNAAGMVDSTLATVTVATAPSITTQPSSSTINSGSTATLTVTATGTAPLTYQWYQGAVGTTTTPVGTNSATFTTLALTATTTYWVRITNAAGTVDSTLATVTVRDLALIPAGSFTMGRTSGDTESNAPPVTVTVSAFYMGKNEVTKALWDEVRTWATANGYTDLATGAGKAANHPVQVVSWWDVIKWCNARSEKEGLTPCYRVSGAVMKTGTTAPTVNWSANGYRLPTEAEWEKAARGGVSGKRFPWGTDTISHSQANYRASTAYSYDSSGAVNIFHPTYATGLTPYTSPVGSFAANGYGLNDMAGNVREWCWDWYSASTYVNGATDPRGAASGTYRVNRGGSWGNYADSCRAAARNGSDDPANKSFDFGFRVARSSVP